MSASDRELRRGAGCVVSLGVLGLLPALTVGIFCGGLVWIRGVSVAQSIRWTSVGAFFASGLAILTPSHDENSAATVYLFIVLSYAVMFWQWIAAFTGWWTFLAPRRLWAVSSGYFIMAPALILYENYAFLSDPESAREKWTLVGMVLFLPVMFLMLTIPLWLRTPRPERCTAISAQ